MAIDPSLASTHHHLGIAFQTLGRFDDAARAYQWAGKLAPRRAHLVLPNARIVHARRDPLDTCFSC
jgi:cytochrome c-type biogenesis protein CcmH/NrfG